MQRFARGMIRFRIPMLFVGLALTLLLYPSSEHIEYDRSIRNLFSDRDPHAKIFASVREEFGGKSMCLFVYSDPQLLSASGMQRLDDLSKKLKDVPGILKATSLADMPKPSATYRFEKDLLDWFRSSKTDSAELSREIAACELYSDLFLGSDGETAAVILEIDPAMMKSAGFSDTLAKLRELAGENEFPTSVVGTPVLINDVYDFIEQDSKVLTRISTLAVLLVVLILLRNLRWVLLPMSIVLMALIVIRAYMAGFDIQLTIIGSMTTALVTVIGIATTIHIAVRYQEEYDAGGEPQAALERTLVAISPAVFWTCTTTAVGFGALAVSGVLPVHNYGLVMALASLAVGLASLLLVPAGVLLGSFQSAPRRAPGEARLTSGLGTLAQLVGNHGLLTAVVSICVLAIAGLGLLRLEVETDFTRNFRAGNPLLEGYRFVEDRLGGSGVIELDFETPETLTPEFLDRVRECQDRLRKLPFEPKVVGLVDLLDLMDESVIGLSRVPRTIVLWLKLKAFESFRPDLLGKMWNSGSQRMRIQIRVREQQTVRSKTDLIDQVQSTSQEVLGDSVRVTGLYVLLVHLIDSLLSDQWLALGVSAMGIYGMLSLAFRSPRLGLVAFVPNLVPILFVLGLMGWLGLKINVATAMIGSISMGLVVDSGIHYISRFRQEQRRGADFETALSRTHQSTGKAMVFANLALMLGFGVLCFSGFVPTMHFGLLVSIAMLGGLIGNLVLLPVLLRAVCQ